MCNVSQKLDRKSKIEFSTENVGLAGIIWPAKNYYHCEFDSSTFNITKWSKKINQGRFKKKFVDNYIDSIAVESMMKKVEVLDNTKNIFSLLAMAQVKQHLLRYTLV